MTAEPHARLLIVDDEAAQMKALCETLKLEGYSTTGFTSANEALAALRGGMFDLVLTDLMMPEMDGVALLRTAFEIDSNLVGIVMTGHGTVDTAVEALKAGALDYILKPFKLSAILPVLTRTLAARRLRMENIHLREAIGIYKLSMAASVAFDFDSVLQRFADAAFQHAQAREVSILLPSADGKELRVAAARGPNAPNIQGRHLPFTGELADWLARSRQLLAQPEELIEVQPEFLPAMRSIARGASIPMLAGGRFIGILNFTPGQPDRPLTLGQSKALHILASAAASALDSSSLLEQLRDAERRYRRLSEEAPDVVFRYELFPERRFSYVNPAVTALTGYTPEEHYAAPDLGFTMTHREDRPLLEGILRGAYPNGSAVTMRWTHKNGSLIWVEQRSVLEQDRAGNVVAVEGVARDVTERKQLEEQLRHAQKMDAIGRLTAGVAHDFNNLLTVINGYSDLTLREIAPGSPSRRKIDEVRKAGEQAAALTRQLLAMGRKQVAQPHVVDINAVVKRNSNILRRVIGEDIEFVTALDPDLGAVKADEGQIEQVLLNLAVNSRDAMPKGGRLTIETRNGSLEETDKKESRVVLAVRDTGCGMDATIQSRVFEPFFTTKETGRGTGLGLSIVYGIVKESGGAVRLFSEPGKGTTFEIYLPRVKEKCVTVGPVMPSELKTGAETILVVEDDAAVRQLVCAILGDAGYEILKARNSAEALHACQQQASKISLVVADLVMPGLSGPALIEKLRRIDPRIRILYTSGYADETIRRYSTMDAAIPFIQKPFSAAGLLKKIREALDAPVKVAENAARPS